MKVLCFGDSNTYGYDPRSWLGGRYDAGSRWVDLLALKTGWEIQNQGQNGREIPRRPVSIPMDTDLLVVMLGTNDLLQGCTPQGTAERMEQFLTGLDFEREKILLVSPPPMTFGEWVQEERLAADSACLAGLYRELAVRLGVRFADAGLWGVALAYDGVHFTEQGHKSFAEGLYREIFKDR